MLCKARSRRQRVRRTASPRSRLRATRRGGYPARMGMPSGSTVDPTKSALASRQRRRALARGLLLGVVLSMFGAGSASAQGYFIDATAYCHATGQVSQDCIVGSPVTITPKAQGGTGNETFDFDSDTFENGRAPEVFNAKQATFTYARPGNKEVGIWATDGSGSVGGYSITIVDPDGKPDPGAGPAYKRVANSVGALLNRSTNTCQVFGDLEYQSYQNSSYTGRVEITYRPKNARTAKQKRYRRFTSIRKSQAKEPSYDSLYGSIFKRFNPNGSRLIRLAKKNTFRFSVTHTVYVNGQKVDSRTVTKRFWPRACRVPT